MSSPCPPPVYAVDTSLAELCTAELLLVAALHLFALPHPDWRGGFVAARIAAAAPAFDALFGIVAAAALRPLDVRCPHSPVLGRDEARFLQLVSLLQQQRHAAAAAILAEWLPSTALRRAILPAQGLAAAMGQGGLVVPLRHAEAAVLQRITPAHADRGLVLMQ